MVAKGVKHDKSKLKKSNGAFDIRDLIRKAQDEHREKEEEEEAEPQDEIMTEADDDDDGIEEEDVGLDHLKNLLKDGPVGELKQEETLSESVPLPRRKTEYERYLKSKERKEQIRKYNEVFIKESREERAQMRARVRQRENSDDEEETVSSMLSSPTKKVRFRI